MYRLFLILILLFPGLCQAAEDTSKNWTVNLYFENDLFAESDQNYTNGLRLSWISPDLSDYIEDPALPSWLRTFNKRLTFFHPSTEGLERNLVFSIGQTIYTPEDINAKEVVKDDRPYAGWLFTRFAYHSKSEYQLDSMELSIGMVGPASLGEKAQNAIHDLRGFDKFQGWDNQLKNELGLQLVYEHKQKLINNTPRNGRFGYDFIGHAGGALGNIGIYINVGGELRWGWLIPNDFGSSAVRPGGDNSAPGSNWDPRINAPGKIGLHFFVTFDVRLVANSLFLDGNTFEDSHSVDIKHLVGDAAVGISTVFSGVKISYAQVFRSKEFELQDGSHSYGSLSLSYSF